MFRLLVSVTLATSALATTFEKCSNEEPAPVNVRLSDCTEQPCDFVRGKVTSLEVDFIPDHNITQLRPFAQTIALGVPVEYKLPQNACKSLVQKTCPLAKDEQVTYALKMPIPSFMLPVRLTVRFALIDSVTNQVVTCFKIAGRVV